MKPLTIEELKALEVGDWVWIEAKENKATNGKAFKRYFQIEQNGDCSIFVYLRHFNYSDYGKTWLAYKNREQAEAKGEIMELPCKVGDYVYIVDNDRHWAKIDTIRIYEEHNGAQKIVYEWVQLDIGVDITELWDEDEFDSEEIGKTVFIEKVHGEKIKELIDAENKKFDEWEQQCEAERQELRGEK